MQEVPNESRREVLKSSRVETHYVGNGSYENHFEGERWVKQVIRDKESKILESIDFIYEPDSNRLILEVQRDNRGDIRKWTEHQYDENGNNIKETFIEPLENSQVGVRRTIQSEFNPSSHLTNITDKRDVISQEEVERYFSSLKVRLG